MKRVVITGGAGFIGSHLVDLLLAKDFKVICLDSLLTGRLENIRLNLKDKKFSFLKHDVSLPLKIRGPVDYILHFASPASPKDYEKYPLETLKAGSLGTLNALEIARKKKAIFILASTSEVYGDPLVSPQKESYYGHVNSIGPRSCYDEAKRFAEALTVNYARIYHIDARIIRIFNTYGPRMRANDGRVIPNFIKQALKNEPLTIYGWGKQTRSFCYVTDLVNAIYLLMMQKKKNIGAIKVMNLGNPETFSILGLATLISTMMRQKLHLKYLPLPVDDPKQRVPDISRAKKLLDWQPSINLKIGLQKIIAWFKEQNV